MLTAAHCIDPEVNRRDLNVQFGKGYGKPLNAKVAAVVPFNEGGRILDLALLKLDLSSVSGLRSLTPLAIAPPSPGIRTISPAPLFTAYGYGPTSGVFHAKKAEQWFDPATWFRENGLA